MDKKLSVGELVKSNLRNYSMFIMLALILVVFSFLTNGINLNSRNIANIFMQNSYILLLAIGMMIVIIIGNIDLSVGSVCAFTGAISVMIYNSGVNFFFTVIFTLLIGLALGSCFGFFIAYLKIPAFIVTLAGMLLFRGLTYIVTNVTPITPHADEFKNLAIGSANIPSFMAGQMHVTPIAVGIILFMLYFIFEFFNRKHKAKNGYSISSITAFLIKSAFLAIFIALLAWKFATYRGIPAIVVVLGICIAIYTFIMKNTIIGRYIYAVGGNARSAKLSGINSEMVVFVAHMNMGMICGLAGLVFTGYMNSALPAAGVNFELDAIAACYIGGASTSGGIGTIIGAIVGGLVMASINNGMSLMNIAAAWQFVVKAIVLLFAVWYDIYNRRKAGLV
ncbi:MAG: ABC transporter permease subunit [Treponemataceae bacterium]